MAEQKVILFKGTKHRFKGCFVFFTVALQVSVVQRKKEKRMQNKLRQEVKLLKALQGISYTEVAEYLEIKPNSLYCWLNNQYELSFSKALRLQEVISMLKEG